MFLLGTVFTQGPGPLSRLGRSQEEQPCHEEACPAGARTSRPELRAHGPGVLVELVRLFVGVGLYLQCELGSSTCPGSSINIHSMLANCRFHVIC